MARLPVIRSFITSNKFLMSFLASLCFSFSLFFFAPLDMFFRNFLNVNFMTYQIAPLLLALAVIVTTLLSLVVANIPEKMHAVVANLLVACAILIWLQSNIIVWSYGRLDGSLLDLSTQPYRGVIDSLVWIAVIGAVIIFRANIYGNIRTIALAFLLVSLCNSLYLFVTLPENPEYKMYETDNSDEFNFSKKGNIIIVILDSFQTDTFQEIVAQDPSYAKIFDGFMYFRNATSSYSFTYPSMTAVLTTEHYKNTMPIQSFMKQAYYSPSSIPRILSKHDYSIEIHPLKLEPYPGLEKVYFHDPQLISNIKPRNTHMSFSGYDFLFLMDLAIFRAAPHYAKKFVYNNGRWLLSFWAMARDLRRKARAAASYNTGLSDEVLMCYDIRFILSMMSNSKSTDSTSKFKLIHLQGPHRPFIFNEHFKRITSEDIRVSYKEQARASLKIVDSFLKKLKEIAAYNNSMIVIMGDHGSGHYKSRVDFKAHCIAVNGNESPQLIERMANGIPLLLVKRKGEHGAMKISNAPVSLADIPATVFAHENIKGNYTGGDMFAMKSGEPRERVYYWFGYEGTFHWNNQYLPALHKYTINGFSWDPASWKETGVIYKSAR